MKEKPGVMLYFDRLPYLNRMTREQRGDLFLWIMEYAQYGVVPEVEDPMLGMAWDVVKPAIDLDTERYAAKCEKNRENIQKRWNKTSNTTVSNRIPNTKTNQTQKQTHTQKQSQDAQELLRVAERRLKEWKEERARLEAEAQGRISSARAECADCTAEPGRIASELKSAVGATCGRPP